MIRRELVIQPDGTALILVRSGLRVELHDMQGNIVEGRDTTKAEQADDQTAAAAAPRGRHDRLTHTTRQESVR